MEIVRLIFLAIHLLGFAAVVGGWFAHFKQPTVTKSQFWGAIVIVLSGLVLFGLAEMMGEPNRIKLTIKLVLGITVLVVAWVGQRKVNKGELVPTGIAHATGGTALITALVAVLWQ
ncbi:MULTISPECIES: hypothetical protein [Auritidibacter]|uniref:hypothetical protein n=1 Tax=Auritidibacter TaxID=1160973 RepID=UPI000D73F657|nr:MULTISPECIES: hypothetical protein [Auritidibacter]AXR73684.1 hypothetical protein DCC27_004510 [Auritidibacter sp. NML130574]WHS27754.1 hypothetical protein QM395_10350 [Auritidibacter ignavus]